MLVQVDMNDPVPPYEQIRRQLATMIESGHLVAGTKLPTVRQLARDLGLAANTVARAYKALEEIGLLDARPRIGTVVALAAPRKLSEAEIQKRLNEAATDYLREVYQLGHNLSDAHDAVDRIAQK